MKRISFVVLFLLFICITSNYNSVHAQDLCDESNPIIHNAQDIHVKVGVEPDYLLGVYATDKCGRTLDGIIVNKEKVNISVSGPYRVYYYAESTSQLIMVYVEDNFNHPYFKGLQNYTLEVNEGTTINFTEGVKAYDKDGKELSSDSITVITTGLDYTKLGHYTVTYQIKNNDAILVEQNIVVNIVDTTAPEIKNQKDIKLEVHKDLSNYDWWGENGIDASDNSQEEVLKEVDITNLNIDKLGQYTVTFISTDSMNHRISVDVNVTVVDETNPIIKGISDHEIDISEQRTGFDFKNGLVVEDNYDGIIDNSFVDIDSHYVDFTKPGRYPVDYFVTDSSGNCSQKTIYLTIKDTTLPEITGFRDFEIPVGKKDTNLLEGISATDNVDGDLTNSIRAYTNRINFDQIGTYSLYYLVSDSSGNQAKIKVNVTIVDKEIPHIDGVKDLTVEVHSTDVNYLDGVTAIDNNDGDLTSSIQIDTSNLNIDELGTYTIVYIVEDSQGNVRRVECQVSVVDTTKPEITGYKDIKIHLNESYNILSGIVATDNYDGDLTSQIKVKGFYNISEVGVYTIKLEVKDSSNNVNTVTFKLTVVKEETKKKVNLLPKGDYSMYYIISIIGISLAVSGYLGYKSRRRKFKK